MFARGVTFTSGGAIVAICIIIRNFITACERRRFRQTHSSSPPQIKSARENGRNVVEMTKLAKVQLMELRAKARRKIAKLWTVIIILGILNLFLIWRMIKCKGNFFC